jgi:hypothetical protein
MKGDILVLGEENEDWYTPSSGWANTEKCNHGRIYRIFKGKR